MRVPCRIPFGACPLASASYQISKKLSKSGNGSNDATFVSASGVGGADDAGSEHGVGKLDKAKKAAWEGDLTLLKTALKKQDYMHEDDKGRCVHGVVCVMLCMCVEGVGVVGTLSILLRAMWYTSLL